MLDLQGRTLNPDSIGRSVESFLTPGAITVHDTFNLSEEVIVEISGGGLSVKAVLPDSFGFGVQNNWSPALGQLSDSKNLGAFDEVIKLITGSSLAGNPLFARASYKGTEPLSIPLKLNFADLLSPYENVWIPTTKLIRMASPSVVKSGNIFSAVTIPGPASFPELQKNLTKILAKDKNKTTISERPLTVRFGKLVQFKNCYIKSINVQFESYLINGYPTTATIDLVIGTQDSISIQNFEAVSVSLRNQDSLKRLGWDDFRSKFLGY